MGYEVGVDRISVCLIIWADTQHIKTIAFFCVSLPIKIFQILKFSTLALGSHSPSSNVTNNSQSAVNNFNLKGSL